MNSNKKIGVFTDIGSLHKNIKYIYSDKLDYQYYLECIKGEGTIYRAFAYGTQVDSEARKFIDFLKIIGFETKYLQAKVLSDKKVIRYDITPHMIVDIVRIVDKLDIIVLGTSNMNILPVIPYIKDKGVEVIIFSCKIPNELKNISDDWWEINEDHLESLRDKSHKEKTNGSKDIGEDIENEIENEEDSLLEKN